MKQLFRCAYCDKIGTAEQITEHEKEYRNIYQIALDNAISDIDYKYHDFGEYIPKERLDEIKLLQELVDKNESRNVLNKKTITIFDGINTYDEGWEGCCPNCKSIVKQSFYEEEVNYCSYCGQKLSWKQNENEKEE